jgi:hypothetical protein
LHVPCRLLITLRTASTLRGPSAAAGSTKAHAPLRRAGSLEELELAAARAAAAAKTYRLPLTLLHLYLEPVDVTADFRVGGINETALIIVTVSHMGSARDVELEVKGGHAGGCSYGLGMGT